MRIFQKVVYALHADEPLPAELVDQRVVLRLRILKAGSRREEISGVGEAIGAYRAQVGEAEVAAKDLQDIPNTGGQHDKQ